MKQFTLKHDRSIFVLFLSFSTTYNDNIQLSREDPAVFSVSVIKAYMRSKSPEAKSHPERLSKGLVREDLGSLGTGQILERIHLIEAGNIPDLNK